MRPLKVRALKTARFLNENMLKNPRFWVQFGLLICVLGTATGFAAEATAEKQVETLTKTTIDTIFSPTLRKLALAFGAGSGAVLSYTGGSISPLLRWGGLGMMVNFVPKFIDWISGLTT